MGVRNRRRRRRILPLPLWEGVGEGFGQRFPWLLAPPRPGPSRKGRGCSRAPPPYLDVTPGANPWPGDDGQATTARGRRPGDDGRGRRPGDDGQDGGLRRLAVCDALLRQQRLQFAGLEHLHDDVAAADELALDVELRDGRPLRELLDALAQFRRPPARWPTGTARPDGSGSAPRGPRTRIAGTSACPSCRASPGSARCRPGCGRRLRSRPCGCNSCSTLFGCGGLQREGVQLAPHAAAQRGIDDLVLLAPAGCRGTSR